MGKIKNILMLLIAICIIFTACSKTQDIDREQDKIVVSGTKNIWIMGDSIAAYASPKGNGSAGWGSYLQLYLKSEVSIKNTAVGGASASSYITNGTYGIVMDRLQKDDCVIIQFGHNDAYNMEIFTDPYGDSSTEGSFKNILKNQYIIPILEKGAHPILSTSVVAADFDVNGELYTMIYADHAQAMRELVEECKEEGIEVFLIDTYAITDEYYRQIGQVEASMLHSGGNHYNSEGAIYAAGIIAQEMKKLGIECCNELRTTEEVKAIDEVGGYDIYAIGVNGMVTNYDIKELEKQYITEGMDAETANANAISDMLEKEALYQAAIKSDCIASETEVEDYVAEVKNNISAHDLSVALVKYVTEDSFWKYKEYAVKRDLSVEKYIKQLEGEYEASEDGKTFDQYLENLKETLTDEENYVIILDRMYNIVY